MFNKVILVGNLTRDIELRYLPSGSAVAKSGIAVNRNWKDKATNEPRQETMFVDITIFGRSAEVANQYLGKGKKVLIEGRLVLEQWVDQSGQKRSKHVVGVENFQFLENRGEHGSDSFDGGGYEDIGGNFDSGGYSQPAKSQPSKAAPNKNIDIHDDEIPF